MNKRGREKEGESRKKIRLAKSPPDPLENFCILYSKVELDCADGCKWCFFPVHLYEKNKKIIEKMVCYHGEYSGDVKVVLDKKAMLDIISKNTTDEIPPEDFGELEFNCIDEYDEPYRPDIEVSVRVVHRDQLLHEVEMTRGWMRSSS